MVARVSRLDAFCNLPSTYIEVRHILRTRIDTLLFPRTSTWTHLVTLHSLASRASGASGHATRVLPVLHDPKFPEPEMGRMAGWQAGKPTSLPAYQPGPFRKESSTSLWTRTET